MGSKNYFNNVAHEWDEMRNEFFSASIREKAIDRTDLKPGSIAVDIGAGTGFVTEELLKREARVIAVDQSQKMLEIMEQKFGNNSSIEYKLGDSTNIPIENNSVDFVFANMYLHHVEIPLAAIKEMHRILKPGGKLVITDLDEHKHEFLRIEQHDYWLGFHRDDINAWFEKARFNNIEVNCLDEVCGSDSHEGEHRADISIFIASGIK